MKIYLVTATCGAWEDTREWNVRAFTSKKAAEVYAQGAQYQSDALHERAVYRGNAAGLVNDFDPCWRGDPDYQTEYTVEELELEGAPPHKEPFRLIVCIDVDADTLEEAYGKVYKGMGKVTGPGTGLDWESSDEAYDPDGNKIDEADLSKARVAVIDARDAQGKVP
jgi:hypothetical protein